MNRLTATMVMVAVATSPIAGQEFSLGRDFLTEFEADQVRLAQDPNDRIPLYLEFAKLRLALVDQLMAKEEPGRGAKVHDNLSELGRIIEAVDMVVDDALLRDIDLSKSLPELLNTERELLSRLERLAETDPVDLWRYEFVLEDAVYILTDSIEITSEDPNVRKQELIEADDAEKAAREKLMSPERRKDVQETEREARKEEQEQQRKRPSLLKEGETLPERRD